MIKIHNGRNYKSKTGQFYLRLLQAPIGHLIEVVFLNIYIVNNSASGMRYLTLSPLLRLRLENTNNIICVLGGQYHHEYIGNRVHTLGVYNYAEET